MRLIERLVERLEPGGIGAIHVLQSGRASLRHAAGQLAGRVPGVRRLVARLRSHRRASDPPMQMNAYDLDAVAALLRSKGCRRLELSFTEHGGGRGVMVHLRRDDR